MTDASLRKTAGGKMRTVIAAFVLIVTLHPPLALAQDKPEETLSAVVALQAKIQPNARSADTLGLQRTGTAVLVREGYALTIGYLVIEAEAVTLTGADGRTIPA